MASKFFHSLGSFKDAKQQAEYVDSLLQFYSTRHVLQSAPENMTVHKLEEASILFHSLGSFKDAKQQAEYTDSLVQFYATRNALQENAESMTLSELKNASKLFHSLGSFKDASKRAEYVDSLLDYYTRKHSSPAFLRASRFPGHHKMSCLSAILHSEGYPVHPSDCNHLGKSL